MPVEGRDELRPVLDLQTADLREVALVVRDQDQLRCQSVGCNPEVVVADVCVVEASPSLDRVSGIEETTGAARCRGALALARKRHLLEVSCDGPV